MDSDGRPIGVDPLDPDLGEAECAEAGHEPWGGTGFCYCGSREHPDELAQGD